MEINNVIDLEYKYVNGDVYYSVHPVEDGGCWQGVVYEYDADNGCWNSVLCHQTSERKDHIWNHINMMLVLREKYAKYIHYKQLAHDAGTYYYISHGDGSSDLLNLPEEEFVVALLKRYDEEREVKALLKKKYETKLLEENVLIISKQNAAKVSIIDKLRIKPRYELKKVFTASYPIKHIILIGGASSCKHYTEVYDIDGNLIGKIGLYDEDMNEIEVISNNNIWTVLEKLMY